MSKEEFDKMTESIEIEEFDDMINKLDSNLVSDSIVKEILEKIINKREPLQIRIIKALAKKLNNHNFIYIKNLLKNLEKNKKEKKTQKEISDKKEIIDTFNFNDNSGTEILVTKNSVYKRTWIWNKALEEDRTRDLKVFDKQIEVLYKTIDTLNGNRELLTFKLGDILHKNIDIYDILPILRPYIFTGREREGFNIMKRVIGYYMESVEERKADYITGFLDGWHVPFEEEEKKYTIICYTDIQNNAYKNLKNTFVEYTGKELIEICKDIKRFIEISVMNKCKLTEIISFAMNSPIHQAFIDLLGISFLSYLPGARNTGRSNQEDFWVTNFFKVNETHYSVVDMRRSQIQDILSASTFCSNIQELEEDGKNRGYIQESIPTLKNICVSRPNYSRKKGGFQRMYARPMTGTCMFDTNVDIQDFMNPSMISRLDTIRFTQEDVIDSSVNFKEWIELKDKLTKKKLFYPLYYQYTKNWTNKDIKKRIESIPDPIGINFLDYPRLRELYLIKMFGIQLFEDIINVHLSKVNDKIELEKGDIIENLKINRQAVGSDLLEQFKKFIELLYLKIYENIKMPSIEVSKEMLKFDNHGNLYLEAPVIRVFKKYYGLQEKGSETLGNNLREAMKNKEDIKYINTSIIINGMKKSIRGIRIKAHLLPSYLEIPYTPKQKTDNKKGMPPTEIDIDDLIPKEELK